MKEKLSPLPHDGMEEIPASMRNLFEKTEEDIPMDTDFDFAALDALLDEESSAGSESEAVETGTVSEDAELPDEAAATSLPEPAPVESHPEPEAQAPDMPPDTPRQQKAALLGKLWARITGSRKAKALAACAAVLVLLLAYAAGILISVAVDPFENRILANTTIGGIPVGGMTRSEAYRLLKESTEATFTQEVMTVFLPDAAIYLSPEQTGAKFQPWDAVRDAFQLGRKGTDAEKQAAIDAAQLEGTHIEMLPYMTLDQEYIRTQLEGYAVQFNLAYADASYQITGTMPDLSEENYLEDAPGQVLQLTMGTPQVELDVDTVLKQILDAYSCNTFSVTIETITPIAIPPAPDLEAIYQEFYTAPVDAALDLVNYGRISGSYGYAIDMDTAKKLIAEADYGETLSIPMIAIKPEILGDAVYFRDELGYCETPHTNNENRNTNLRLACAALDGLILQPGETFSFNGTVGQRTKEKGYMPAPAYSGTRTVDSTGGGVCQVSTTVYNAALLADMEIVFRINHGYRSGYIGIGLDATVNWGGPDFQFRNNSHFPIMIKAEVSDGYVKVKLLGTDEKDYYIIMTSGYSEEDDYYTAWSYKNKYDKETGELISKEREAFSRYMK